MKEALKTTKSHLTNNLHQPRDSVVAATNPVVHLCNSIAEHLQYLSRTFAEAPARYIMHLEKGRGFFFFMEHLKCSCYNYYQINRWLFRLHVRQRCPGLPGKNRGKCHLLFVYPESSE